MRIGIDARLNYYRAGGIAEYTRHVVRELAQLDQASDYRIIHHIRDSHTLVPGPNFRRLNTFTPSHHRLESWALSLELWPRRLDVLHCPDAISPRRGARHHVLTIHDLHYIHYPQFMTRESQRYYLGQIGRAVQTASHILVSSSATREDLVSFLSVPDEKITVHMLGVDDAFCPAPAGDIQTCRVRYGLPEQYLLFVGTFEPRKNIPNLLKAYDRLRQSMQDTPPLVMVGRRGWLYEDIFAAVSDLSLDDAVIWIENAPWEDLPALYSGASVFVLPSHYEGFGLTALEAMACGTPPVVSNRSSLPEVVGSAGLLVDPDDPDEIAATIQRVLTDSDLYNHLRQSGLARARTFTWRRTAEIVHQVYDRVVSA